MGVLPVASPSTAGRPCALRSRMIVAMRSATVRAIWSYSTMTTGTRSRVCAMAAIYGSAGRFRFPGGVRGCTHRASGGAIGQQTGGAGTTMRVSGGDRDRCATMWRDRDGVAIGFHAVRSTAARIDADAAVRGGGLSRRSSGGFQPAVSRPADKSTRRESIRRRSSRRRSTPPRNRPGVIIITRLLNRPTAAPARPPPAPPSPPAARRPPLSARRRRWRGAAGPASGWRWWGSRGW